jgi:hypothetical protein
VEHYKVFHLCKQTPKLFFYDGVSDEEEKKVFEHRHEMKLLKKKTRTQLLDLRLEPTVIKS